MHRIARGLVLLAVAIAGTAHAHADDEPFVAAPGHAVAVGLMGRASQIGGQAEGGAALDIELALGSGRWQYFIEGMAGPASLDQMPNGPSGYVGRAGAGARWLARQFQPERGGGIELYLEALTGVERYWWQDGGRMTRPDLGFGIGMQMRAWEFHGLTMRLGSRVVFAPSDRDAALVVCHGSGCPMGTSTGIAGYMAALMVAW